MRVLLLHSLEEELVNEDVTGRTFKDPESLAKLLTEYVDGSSQEKVPAFRENVISRVKETGSWEDEWTRNGLPLFKN